MVNIFKYIKILTHFIDLYYYLVKYIKIYYHFMPFSYKKLIFYIKYSINQLYILIFLSSFIYLYIYSVKYVISFQY
jgi:hypothetical protein